MFDRIGQWQPDRGAAVVARAITALALIALAVIHVVDLPGTLGPTPLVGIGYLAIIAGAILIGGAMIARSHWLAWAPGRRRDHLGDGRIRTDPRSARRFPWRSRRRR